MNVLLALLTTVAVGVFAHLAGGVPVWWSVAIAVPAGAGVLVASTVSGVFDVDWTPEADEPAAATCLYASSLGDRLGQAATDHYRFTSRVRPRLRRLALDLVRRRTGVEDLRDPRARELLGAELHDLLTAREAHLPPPKDFTALVRRLEER